MFQTFIELVVGILAILAVSIAAGIVLGGFLVFDSIWGKIISFVLSVLFLAAVGTAIIHHQ